MDVATGAAVADDNAISTVISPSLTKDKGVYVGVLVAFEGACVGGRGGWGRRPSVVVGDGAVLDPAAECAPLEDTNVKISCMQEDATCCCEVLEVHHNSAHNFSKLQSSSLV